MTRVCNPCSPPCSPTRWPSSTRPHPRASKHHSLFIGSATSRLAELLASPTHSPSSPSAQASGQHRPTIRRFQQPCYLPALSSHVVMVSARPFSAHHGTASARAGPPGRIGELVMPTRRPCLCMYLRRLLAAPPCRPPRQRPTIPCRARQHPPFVQVGTFVKVSPMCVKNGASGPAKSRCRPAPSPPAVDTTRPISASGRPVGSIAPPEQCLPIRSIYPQIVVQPYTLIFSSGCLGTPLGRTLSLSGAVSVPPARLINHGFE
jgi:hypothetical protein